LKSDVKIIHHIKANIISQKLSKNLQMASKSSKTFPSTSASKFEVGHVANGEDGLKYIVTSQVGKNDKIKKSWTLFEESQVITEEPIVQQQEIVEELVQEVKELEIVVKQKRQKREKKTSSDEEKPKRSPNEYNRFVSTKMSEYRESHPEITNGREKMKMAAAEWKTMKSQNAVEV
jgi:hypothetical protein